MTKLDLARIPGAALCAAAALLIASAPASAATDPATDNPPAARDATVKPQDDTRRYCIVEERTGTNIKTRVCKTRSEWIEETGVDPATLRR